MASGKIRAEHKTWTSHRDLLGGHIVEGESSGVLSGREEELAPGPRLEAALHELVARGFAHSPRPLTVRVVYEGEGVPAGETTFTVYDYYVKAGKRTLPRVLAEQLPGAGPRS
jgi:hypothetical protein